MNDLFVQALAQVPSLTVLTALVIVFLKDRAKSTELMISTVESFQNQVELLSTRAGQEMKECRDTQITTRQCMQETTESVRELLQQLRHDRERQRRP